MPASLPHKAHDRPVALAGGLILVAVLAFSLLVFPELRDSPLALIFPALLTVMSFGLLDDFRGLSAPVKVFGQSIAAFLVINAGFQIALFSQNWLNVALTVIWIIGITNAYNFLDGGDGLALGMAIIAAIFLFFGAIISGQHSLSLSLLVFLGASVGLYYFNAQPATAFLGDSGAQFIGFLLAAFALNYAPKGFPTLSSWFVPILLFSVPIFDMSLVVSTRLVRRLPIYQANLDHTYHRLLSIIGSEQRVLVWMFFGATLISSIAFSTLNLPIIIGNLIFIAILGTGIWGIIYLERSRKSK